MTVLARAASEREPPMTLGHWQDFVGRYFALAVALRRAIRVFEYKQDQRLRMQGGKSLIPELTPEQEALRSEQAQKRADKEDAEFQKQMNYLAEHDAYAREESLVWFTHALKQITQFFPLDRTLMRAIL